ncbi:MAG: metallophosphoesterase [Candidatus Poribacteria bacterium]
MKIGIISDTHDNIPKIKEAVSIFNTKQVEFVIHAGDYIAPFSIALLDDLKCDYVGVFGNNDGEKIGLAKKSKYRIKVPPHNITLENRKIIILHEPNDIDNLIKSQNYDIIIYGHTHNPVIEKHNGILVINPGECGGWLSGKSTIAIVDLSDLSAEIVNVF